MNFITRLVTTAFVLPMTLVPAPAEAFGLFGQWGSNTYDASTPQEFCEAAKTDALKLMVDNRYNNISITETFEAESSGNLHRYPDVSSYGGDIKGSCYFNFKYNGESGVEFGHLNYQIERFDGDDYVATAAPILGWSRRV